MLQYSSDLFHQFAARWFRRVNLHLFRLECRTLSTWTFDVVWTLRRFLLEENRVLHLSLFLFTYKSISVTYKLLTSRSQSAFHQALMLGTFGFKLLISFEQCDVFCLNRIECFIFPCFSIHTKLLESNINYLLRGVNSCRWSIYTQNGLTLMIFCSSKLTFGSLFRPSVTWLWIFSAYSGNVVASTLQNHSLSGYRPNSISSTGKYSASF